MTINQTLSAGLALCMWPILPAAAQTEEIRTESSSSSTEKSPHTAAIGQIKLPSHNVSPISGKSVEPSITHQNTNNAVIRKICVGCDPDRRTIGKFNNKLLVDTKLEDIRKLPVPAKQGDLETFNLASAHRERAESAQEKTNGLWQSWLVSVCEGCGDQKPAKAWKLEDWPTARIGPFAPDSPERNASNEKIRLIEPRQVMFHRHGLLEADLSPENVGSIRRLPQH